MKKRILMLLCLVILACMTLTACLLPSPGPGSGSGSGSGETATLTSIVSPKGARYGIDYKAMRDVYRDVAGLFLYVIEDDVEDESDGELVIGDTNRTITAEAKAALASATKKTGNDDEIGFIVYCNGSSIALYWDDHFTLNLAYEYFYENFVLNGVYTAEEGIIYVETMDKSDSKKAQEAIDRANDFAKVAEIYGQEVADALMAHYDLYDERYYIWMANLYDPGTGGFYYSNSGLATPGYLPDLESTQQAFSFFGNAGMYRAYARGVSDAVPQWMQEKAVEWIRSLQSPIDGYFYHPQWESVGASRLSRDLGWATTCLSNFGSKPKWNAPNGTKGEFGKVPGKAVAFTGQLAGDSVVQAVSLVIPTASLEVDQFPERLRSLENWQYYLVCTLNGNSDPNDFTPKNIRTKSYSIGNTVSSQSGQVTQRDKLAIELKELPDENGDKWILQSTDNRSVRYSSETSGISAYVGFTILNDSVVVERAHVSARRDGTGDNKWYASFKSATAGQTSVKGEVWSLDTIYHIDYVAPEA